MCHTIKNSVAYLSSSKRLVTSCPGPIEQHILDTNAGKQQFQAATDVSLTLVLKKLTFKYWLELWPPVVSK